MNNVNIYMNVKDLKKALKNVPDDYEVRYQRIEDVYFEKHGWEPKKLLWGCYGVHPMFDESGIVIKDENGEMATTEEHNEDCYSEYVEVFSAYKIDSEKVFILNAHY